MQLKKIISGGQTGAGLGALDAAIEYRMAHGGWIPKGRKTESGVLPQKYKLQEMPTDSYPARTEKNVIDSDGTVIISRGKLAGESLLTQEFAERHNRSCLHIDLGQTSVLEAAAEINVWIVENSIEILHVVGPSAGKDPNMYKDTKYVIESAILLGLLKVEPEKQKKG